MTVAQIYVDVVSKSDGTPADTLRPALFNVGLPVPANYFVNSSSAPSSSRATLWRWTDPCGANVFQQAGGVDLAPYLQAVPMVQPLPGEPVPSGVAIDNRATRWGDYSGSVLDPDGRTLWHFEEYSKSDANTFGAWGTWASATRFGR